MVNALGRLTAKVGLRNPGGCCKLWAQTSSYIPNILTSAMLYFDLRENGEIIIKVLMSIDRV